MAVTLAFMDERDIQVKDLSLSIRPPPPPLRLPNPTRIAPKMEANCYHQTYTFAKSTLSSLPPSLLAKSSRDFLQNKLNVLVAMVRKREISSTDAAGIVHGVGCLLPPLRPLVSTPPPNTVLIRGMRRSVTRFSLVSTFEKLGTILESEVAPGKGFGFVRFTGSDGIRRTKDMYETQEIEVDDVAVVVQVVGGEEEESERGRGRRNRGGASVVLQDFSSDEEDEIRSEPYLRKRSEAVTVTRSKMITHLSKSSSEMEDEHQGIRKTR